MFKYRRQISQATKRDQRAARWDTPWFYRGIALLLLIALAQVIAACSLYTVRPLNASSNQASIQTNQFDQNFDPTSYVHGIWAPKVIPTITNKAVDLSTVLTALQANSASAERRFASQSSDGVYNFIVKGQGKVVAFNSSSRDRLVTIQLPAFKGQTTILVQIGPVIFGTALRDSLGFINFNQFSNQVQYQQVSDQLNAQAASNMQKIDFAALQGKTITFYGAFTFVTLQQINITPVKIVVEGGA
jgi:predicted lipoprotein